MRVCVRSLSLVALLVVAAVAAVALPSHALRVGLKQRVSGQHEQTAQHSGDEGGHGAERSDEE